MTTDKERMAEEYTKPYENHDCINDYICKHDITCAFKAGYDVGYAAAQARIEKLERVVEAARTDIAGAGPVTGPIYHRCIRAAIAALEEK